MRTKIYFKIIAVALAFFGIFCSIVFSEEISSKFELNWNTDFNIGISQALVANKIRDCGEFKYKKSKEHNGEYLVYCTRDGANWSAYLVWAPIKKVMGPYKADQ